MPAVRKFLKESFPQRGGYKRSADGEEAAIQWMRGEDPRLELLDMGSKRVVHSISLDEWNGDDIHDFLIRHGFEPAKSG